MASPEVTTFYHRILVDSILFQKKKKGSSFLMFWDRYNHLHSMQENISNWNSEVPVDTFGSWIFLNRLQISCLLGHCPLKYGISSIKMLNPFHFCFCISKCLRTLCVYVAYVSALVCRCVYMCLAGDMDARGSHKAYSSVCLCVTYWNSIVRRVAPCSVPPG